MHLWRSKENLLKTLIWLSPFIFPAYFFRFQLAGIPFTFLEVYIYLLFILGLACGGFKGWFNQKYKAYYAAVFLILLGATIGLILTTETMPGPQGAVVLSRRIALGVWKGWVIAPMFYWVIMSRFLKSSDEVSGLMRSLFYSGAVLSIISFAWAIFGSGMTSDFRLSGPYESANYLSLYLVPTVLAGLYFSLHQKLALKKVGFWLHYTSLGVSIAALLFTKSYAAILGLFGAIFLALLCLLIQNPRRRKPPIKGLSIFGTFFILVVISQINTSKFKQFIDFENRSSTSVRLELYEASWGLLKQHPLKGLGPGLFQAHYHDQVHRILGHFPMEWNLPHPHNIFLGFWFNAGILGFIGFIWLLFLMHQKFTYALIPMWGTLIHGLFDMPFWKNDLAMIFWLLLACIMFLQIESKKK